jgi:hypothetical protein
MITLHRVPPRFFSARDGAMDHSYHTYGWHKERLLVGNGGSIRVIYGDSVPDRAQNTESIPLVRANKRLAFQLAEVARCYAIERSG